MNQCTLAINEVTLQWRHNGRDGVSHHKHHNCLPNCLFRRRTKKTSKLHVTGLCAGNSPLIGEFPAQIASNAENVSIWWRHQVIWHSPEDTCTGIVQDISCYYALKTKHSRLQPLLPWPHELKTIATKIWKHIFLEHYQDECLHCTGVAHNGNQAWLALRVPVVILWPYNASLLHKTVPSMQ